MPFGEQTFQAGMLSPGSKVIAGDRCPDSEFMSANYFEDHVALVIIHRVLFFILILCLARFY